MRKISWAPAGHFAFLAPCSPELAAAISRICTDNPAGFDRVAFHREFNASVAKFFRSSSREITCPAKQNRLVCIKKMSWRGYRTEACQLGIPKTLTKSVGQKLHPGCIDALEMFGAT